MTSNAGAESYTLDVLNRLTNATYPNGDTAAYSYDANGNRLSQTFNGVTTNYTYDDAGQLLSDGATSYGYDANGNLITAGADSYTWDWANRMTGATVGGNSASYSYDAFDVRVSSAVNGAASTYLWDRLARYPTLVDDGAYAYIHSAGPQAQIDPSGNRHYLLSDALSSIRGVTDGSGALVGSNAYDAFGAVRSQTGTGSTLGYTGELYTPATGLLHLRTRDLNPALGRFLSADTVQPNAPGSQGFNVYAYVANNPTLWVDPSGHSVSGYAGTIPFLPSVSPSTAVMAGSLSALIAVTLALGRNPLSWRFPENRNTSIQVLATFSLVLMCALIPDCMGATAAYDNAAKQLGADSPFGITGWTAAALAGAQATHPQEPTVDTPVPTILDVPWVVGPWQVGPEGDPDPGGPKWNWAKIGAIVGIGAILATTLTSSTQLPRPQPVPTPAPTSLPTPKGINILFIGGDIPETAKHIAYATSIGQKTRRLHARAGSWPIRWKDSRPVCKKKPAGYWCDEYPFAATIEGGQHNNPSLRPAPGSEQSKQGGNLIGFYTNCGVTRTVVPQGQQGVVPAPGSEFLVEVTPWRNTGWVCSNGNRK